MPWKAVAAIRNAMRGVGFMFSELSIRILAAGTLLTVAAGAYFAISALEWCAAVLALSVDISTVLTPLRSGRSRYKR